LVGATGEVVTDDVVSAELVPPVLVAVTLKV
jgi:hypothetical protein